MSRKLLERHCATLENLEVLHAFEPSTAKGSRSRRRASRRVIRRDDVLYNVVAVSSKRLRIANNVTTDVAFHLTAK